jgi:hypothetical protein
MACNGHKHTRWTADTETACLLALQLHGSLRKAAATIGRAPSAICARRRSHPDFAQRWQAVLDQWRADAIAAKERAIGEAGEVPNRQRCDGWTAKRQRHFLRVLGETGKLGESCTAVGLSRESLLYQRKRYPSFDAACERALRQARASLEQVAYERAVEGWDEPVMWRGEVVGTRRRYDHRLLAMLLRQEQAVTLPRQATDPANLAKVAREAARRAGGFFATPDEA